MFDRDLEVSVIANQAAHRPAGVHAEYQLVARSNACGTQQQSVSVSFTAGIGGAADLQ
jgi:hypothetical protein